MHFMRTTFRAPAPVIAFDSISCCREGLELVTPPQFNHGSNRAQSFAHDSASKPKVLYPNLIVDACVMDDRQYPIQVDADRLPHTPCPHINNL